MKKLNIKQSFETKNFKYGGMSVIISVLVIAILVCVNLLVGKYNWTKDLTKNKMFTMSDQTKKVLSSLNKDVTIYGFYESGKEDFTVKSILNQYKSHSKHITIQYIDQKKYPAKAKKYQSGTTAIEDGSLVVESGNKFKLINSSDFINYDYSNTSNPQPQSLAIEQNLTSAVMYVTSQNTSKVCLLSGHGEATPDSGVTKQLGLENYTTSTIDLATGASKLDNNSILLIYSPQRDISTDEASKIKSFIANGGKAVFLLDITEQDMPNLNSVLSVYGMSLQRCVVVEGNAQYATSNPLYLLPQIKAHDITSKITGSNLRVLIPGAQGLKITNTNNSKITVTPLLVTSESAYGKVNLQASTSEKEKDDIAGPFNVAAAVSDKTTSNEGRLVVITNSTFLNSQVVSATSNANMDLFMNSISWVQNKTENITIRPKELESNTITVSASTGLMLAGIVSVVIPLIVVIIGIRVTSKRKHA